MLLANFSKLSKKVKFEPCYLQFLNLDVAKIMGSGNVGGGFSGCNLVE